MTHLHETNALAEIDYQTAIERLSTLRMPEPRTRATSAMHAVLELERRVGQSRGAMHPAARPIIETTLDLPLQLAIQAQMERRLEQWRADGAGNAAVVVVDLQSAELLAWVGSTSYTDTARSGAIDFTQTRRSPGSALKPFFYALALERGAITPATMLSDIRRSDGLVQNADSHYLGPILPRAALANSRNVPAVEVLEAVGFGSVWGMLDALGLPHANQPEHYGTGLVLGNMPVNLHELTAAYLALASGGTPRDVLWYRGQAQRPRDRVFSEQTARQIALFLSESRRAPAVVSTLWRHGVPFPVAIKTGTSAGFRDAWAMAWSTRYLVGTWVGHPDQRPMRELSGYRAGATLVRDVLFLLPHDDAHGLADVSFPPPRDHHPVRLCALSGKLATPACERVSVEWFAEGHAPSEPCDFHVPRIVERQARTFVDLPARFGEWAIDAGQQHAPLLVREATPIRIRAPRDGMRVVRDPEAVGATLGLSAEIAANDAELVWYVDGRPFRTVRHPFSTRWPLAAGEHTFHAQLGDQRSALVRIRVD